MTRSLTWVAGPAVAGAEDAMVAVAAVAVEVRQIREISLTISSARYLAEVTVEAVADAVVAEVQARHEMNMNSPMSTCTVSLKSPEHDSMTQSNRILMQPFDRWPKS